MTLIQRVQDILLKPRQTWPVIAQEPVLAPHLEPMRAAIAGLLGAAADVVSVKAKSADHLGALGRGEGIAALASVRLLGGAAGE